MFTIIATILIIEFTLKPRLDYTREGKLLLWYGNTTRRYIVILNKI